MYLIAFEEKKWFIDLWGGIHTLQQHKRINDNK